MSVATEESGSIFTTPECSLVLERIASLNHQLGTSLRVCEAYVKYLTNVLLHEDDVPGESPVGMLNFSDQVDLLLFKSTIPMLEISILVIYLFWLQHYTNKGIFYFVLDT